MPGLASAAIFAGTASAGEVFTDEFDSPSLDGKWTVLRPSDSNFAVENSQLLLISSKPGGLSDNTVENVLMPNVELPGGDWTMTVNFSGEFQTAREELGIGVMGTETSYLMAGIVTLGDQYYGWSLSAQIGRTLNKDFHWFQCSLAGMGCNVCAKDRMFFDFAATIPQLIAAKLEKRGQQYIVSVRLGADAKEWTTVERITAINARENQSFICANMKKSPAKR